MEKEGERSKNDALILYPLYRLFMLLILNDLYNPTQFK